MTFRLALALGRTVEELLEGIDSAELTEWFAYYQVEPWGEERADWRSAMIARTMAEIHRDDKSRARPFQIDEFMPKFDGEAEDKSSQSVDLMNAFMHATRGMVNNDGK